METISFSIVSTMQSLFTGIAFGLDCIGFIIPSHNIAYSVGVWFGVTLFGAIQGLLAYSLYKAFNK